jgi:hypothetical protein
VSSSVIESLSLLRLIRDPFFAVATWVFKV